MIEFMLGVLAGVTFMGIIGIIWACVQAHLEYKKFVKGRR